MTSLVSRRRFMKSVSGLATLAILPASFSQTAHAMPSDLAVDAVRKAVVGDFMAAGDLAKQSGDQAAIKLVELLYLRQHGPEAGYARIMAFINSAPNWPLAETLMKRAEKALYDNKESPATILAHFQNRKTLTPYGSLALARAAYASGDAGEGKAQLRDAWGSADIDVELEKDILAEFAAKLSVDDHKYRFARLVYAQESNAAIRQAQNHLNGDYRNAAKVAQALINFRSGADKQYAALPSAMRGELPLQYVLVRYYRKAEEFDKARAILMNVPGDAKTMCDASAWFEERRTIVRRSVGPLQRVRWKAAYAIAKNHGLSTGDMAIDGEFLAGWVALRYLQQPQQALPHFLKIQKLAQTGTDRARASYWIGRTHKADRNVTQARAAFQAASVQSTLYYGQLASEELGRGKIPEEISSSTSSDSAKSRVEQDEVVRALRIMSKAGAKTQLGIFMMALATRFESREELNAVAEIVQNESGITMALRFAKAASLRGHDLDTWAYPIYGLPNWSSMGKPVEKSLVFALSRQESEFDPNAGSSVGAQGLMQLMPATARLIAQQYRVGFSASRLKEPSYNVQLGSAHLADLVAGLNGSYILTLVAYNAGPRRSRDWLAYYGDPRGGAVDPVDWVECIPFNETRQYVQKVMQNLHVYRSRLAPDTVRPMTVDLKRGTPEIVSVASTSPAMSASD
ncbi:MAG: lytic transglycosylase domain-containing protein [Aestuariivirga sp.]